MATIYDVAKAAGVSPKTVSRVLNGDAPVGKSTCEAVRKAMADLGYVPSNAARMMRSNRSGLIGLITGAISQNLEPMEPTGLPDLYIVQGIQQVMSESDHTLMIADTGGNLDCAPALIRTFQQHRVEALIYVADYHQKVTFDPGSATCPLVLVNCFDDVQTPAILPDDEQGQFELTQSLIQSGHKRIAYLTLDTAMVAGDLRSKGYRRALAESGISYDPAFEIMARKSIHSDDGLLLQDAVNTLMSMPEIPTVICCGNDEMALRVYGLLRSKGLRIPEDISVAGYDNYRSIAETLYPPLTTVELPYLEMGRIAGKAVLGAIKEKASLETGAQKVQGSVFWRSSVLAKNSITQVHSNQRRTT